MYIGIKQPYFVPYIGYWQHINFVDLYVIYDDGVVINNGYMHRNTILAPGDSSRINLFLSGKHVYMKTNEVQLLHDEKKNQRRSRILYQNYHKAPYYEPTMALLTRIFENPETNAVLYLKYQIEQICQYLGITTPIRLSSEVCSKQGLTNVLDTCHRICDTVGIYNYVDSVGARKLYQKEVFAKKGIQLSFLESLPVKYVQHPSYDTCLDFVPNLSIIDVMMFNSVETIQEMLKMCKLT